MMTFRPYANHARSAAVLDYKRLGKQRVEASQIMAAAFAAITDESGGWTNHPVVRMWAGQTNPYLDHSCGRIHLLDLLNYYDAIVQEWIERGYRHSMEYRVLPFRTLAESDSNWFAQHELPWGAAQELRHKHILLGKDPEYYGQYWKVRVRSAA